MTDKEFAKLVKGMKAVYTMPSFIPDEMAFKMWFSVLKDLDYRVASLAVQKYIATCEAEPKPASIMRIATDIIGGDEITMTPGEAWRIYWNAVCNSIYHSEEEFEQLPDVIKRAVGGPESLKLTAMSEDINVDVEKSLFERKFLTAQRWERERKETPIAVRNVIDSILAENRNQPKVIEDNRREKEALPAPHRGEGFTERIEELLAQVRQDLSAI